MATGEGQTILVVEDDALVRTALLDALTNLGYATLAATNGQEALAVYEQHQEVISLVLCDWVMPMMGGLALVQALETRHGAPKVLVLSGHPLDRTSQQMVPKNVAGWLLKPLDFEHLAATVAKTLTRPA